MRGPSGSILWMFALVASLAVVRVAAATTLDLSWDACSPLVTNKVPTVPPGPIALVVRATGQAVPHTGFEFRIDLGDADGVLPDAWRFDLHGCPGSNLISIQTDPPTPLCPAFQGAPATVQAGMAYDFPPSGPGPDRWSLFVSSRYPVTSAPPPGAERSLVRVIFNHTYSVAGPTNDGYNCGGFERNLCLTVRAGSARWFDGGGAPVAFQTGQSWLTFRGECRPVPATPGTWGAIKSTYRR